MAWSAGKPLAQQITGAVHFPCAAFCIVLSAAAIAAPGDVAPAPLTEPTETTKPAAFQPGVRIDWARSTVLLDGRVVLRDGPLEFLACFPGKEHESLVLLEGDATHVYLALGLIGLVPATENQRESLCTVRFRWEQDGESKTCDAHAWVLTRRLAQTALPRALRFTGSQRRANGEVAAGESGAGFALVAMPDALLEPTAPRSSRNDELWARARTAAIPAKNTPVTVLISPAKPQPLRIHLDQRGLVWVNKRVVAGETLLELLSQRQLLGDKTPIRIVDHGALRADRRRLQRTLQALPEALPVEFVAASAENQLPDTANPLPEPAVKTVPDTSGSAR